MTQSKPLNMHSEYDSRLLGIALNVRQQLACSLSFSLLAIMCTSVFAQSEFNREIRPIFTQHCIACHGGVKNASGVSFVYRDKAISEAESGEIPIIPGKPGESELIKRVASDDDDIRMPPPEHGPRLSAEEVQTLSEWIEQGAQWSELWSLAPPQEPALPIVKQISWPKNSIDRFVLAKLEDRQLKPSPDATPAQWLRRVSFDLIGLPPTVEQFEKFDREYRADHESARRHAVDGMLDSKHFGERWAAMWLDLARYSDTYGYEKDPHRNIWPWRDWVIRAFNSDMPFDQFTIKQLAGDLLENATADDRLATAFHRNTQNNSEGGTDDEEFRTTAVIDRVNTIWTTWQSTTFGCVQCHAHPYDPYPQQDYYRFAAFFNNTEDCDQNDDWPLMVVADKESDRERASELDHRVFKLRSQQNEFGIRTARHDSTWRAWIPSAASSSGGMLAVSENGLIEASGTLPVGVKYTINLPLAKQLTAIRIKIEPDDADPTTWPERASVLSHVELANVSPSGDRKEISIREVVADFLAGPFDPQESLKKGGPGFGSYPAMIGPRWCVLVLDKPLDISDGEIELIMHQSAAANAGVQACPLRRFSLEASAYPGWSELLADSDYTKVADELIAARSELSKISGTKVPVLVERADEAARQTRLFMRGNRLTLGQQVEAGIPVVFEAGGPKQKLSRLDLAKWMVSDRNPLAARAIANRLWAELFGIGLVETLEDFGTAGAEPSHPELLDHLALKLVHEHKWSLKSFLRELVLSASYAQSSRATTEMIERDPRNRLLARGPRVRLTAEMVRDQALAVSGLLSSKQFGPPVYPPQPDGVWNSVYSGAAWKTSEGEDRFRRAIYTYNKRTSGYPSLLAFDAPTRDACAARRIPTNTPLQALVALNDPAFIEIAQGFAKRMSEGGGEPDKIIARGCKFLTLESPPETLVSSLTKLYGDLCQEWSSNGESSKQLAPKPEEAALVMVANTLLNLDAFLFR